MHFLKERATVIYSELSEVCRRNVRDLSGIHFKEGFFITPEEAAGSETAPFSPFDERAVWSVNDPHAWFTADFTVPDELDGRQLMFSFSTQENGWDAINPQFLFFLDGKITQGVDVNHREVLVSEKAEAGRRYKLDLQAYAGRSEKPLAFNAKYFEFLPSVYGLMMDIKTAVHVLEKLDKNAPACYRLENALTGILNLIDLRDPDSPAFLSSVDEARALAAQTLYGEHLNVIATAIGHTHIDVAWWWTVEQTREKAARSFATAVKLIEEYGGEGFKFQSSQPQLYKFVAERYPELYAKIKTLVAEGKWEAEGGMWLEADCNLTSGESLVRQFLHGKNFFKEAFGVDNKILWLPDVFGYSAALPQIMRKSGIQYFMT
ncbi:MAG: alpha-mannosidase, partial [Clostridiales bacterium]|nr:alpha-mannosidase [Clostridiales bacterium]